MDAEKQPTKERIKQSKVFCVLPWVSASIRPNGNVFPCCIAPDESYRVGSLRESSIEDVLNSSEFRQLRVNMLEEKETPLCQTCYELERSGVKSYRQEQNERFVDHAFRTDETHKDGRISQPHMAYLDVRFSNLCNFRCRYCGPWLSTAWYKDAESLGNWNRHDVLTPTRNPDDLVRQMEPYLSKAEYIYFSGGEPLISKQHYELLEALERRKLFDVTLIYNSNFSVTSCDGHDAFESWRRFKSVQVAASLDAPGRRGEYIRKNQDWNQVIANRGRLKAVSPHVKFSLFPTLSVMNVFSLPGFHRDWLESGHVEPNDLTINVLYDPLEYRIQILPEPLKQQVQESYESHIDFLQKRYGDKAERDVAQFRSALEYLRTQDLSGLLERFKEKTSTLDRIRGERFAEVFPELASLMG